MKQLWSDLCSWLIHPPHQLPVMLPLLLIASKMSSDHDDDGQLKTDDGWSSSLQEHDDKVSSKIFKKSTLILAEISLLLFYLLFDEVSCSHLKSNIKDCKYEWIPYNITHAQASDEKIPHWRKLK